MYIKKKKICEYDPWIVSVMYFFLTYTESYKTNQAHFLYITQYQSLPERALQSVQNMTKPFFTLKADDKNR